MENQTRRSLVVLTICWLALPHIAHSTPPAIAGKPKGDANKNEPFQKLILELAEIENPNLGLSPTMSGEGFAPVSWSRRMFNGILMDHGLRNTDAFSRLVEYGPAALPQLLDSLDDKTPTKLTIKHGGDGIITFGGMWYGHPPAIRWAASDAELIKDLAEQKLGDDKIAEYSAASPEFIAEAKNREFPFFLPRIQREFNPRNPAEKKLIEAARGKLMKMKVPAVASDSLTSYTVTVGDVCYVIIGQITNRSYLAVQYQPTACTYIHSPTHDPQIAKDVRAVWKSNNSTEMILASLKTDLELKLDDGFYGYRQGAILRLGYYFPKESEGLLLDLLAKIISPPQDDATKDRSSYESIEILEAIAACKNETVQKRVFEIMRTTNDVHYFLTLSQAYDTKHKSLLLELAKHFIDTLPEENVDSVASVLKMIGKRFPEEAKEVFAAFVASQSLHRSRYMSLTHSGTAPWPRTCSRRCWTTNGL